MTYKEKKRSMFLGLPWAFTTYTVTDEFISIDSGLLNKVENDCYMYKVIDVRLETTLMERILGIGTIHCFTGDVTDPDLKLQHIKNAKEIKDFNPETVRTGKIKEKDLKYAASGWQSGSQQNGRNGQLQIINKTQRGDISQWESPLFYINFSESLERNEGIDS